MTGACEPGREAVMNFDFSEKEEAFRKDVRTALTTFREGSPTNTDDFVAHVFYHKGDFNTAEGMQALAEPRTRKKKQEY